jgi:hypothetical protein
MQASTACLEGVAIPRDRWRVTLDSGRKLDLAKLIQRVAGKPGSNISWLLTYGSGEKVTVLLKLRDVDGWAELSFGGRWQAFSLVSSPRHLGGLQWYVVCPKSRRRVRVL